MKDSQETNALIEKAVLGNQKALELLLSEIQDMVFNLSLRMLGTVQDAEDAAQEIFVKVMTSLSSFRHESSFSTWVFRIAVNHLRDYRKNMFSRQPLSFEYYGMDILHGNDTPIPDMTGDVDRELLARELKLSCTNVMLQCLDAESRCIFILGTMFHLDSRIAAEILDISPDAYRQRLSRIRKKVAAFLGEYCGLGGSSRCSCLKRVDYAIVNHRIVPERPEYLQMEKCSCRDIITFIETMDELDELSQVFSDLPAYRSPLKASSFIQEMISTKKFQNILHT